MKDRAASADMAAAIQSLSPPRLSNYRAFFDAHTPGEQFGLYRWNEAISLQLFRVIGLAEIVLRNQLHTAISQRYGINGRTGSKDWYHAIRLKQHSQRKVTDALHIWVRGRHVPISPVPSPDALISSMTFGFWSRLLETERDNRGQLIPWADILLETFPGHRNSNIGFWRRQTNRDSAFERVKFCNVVRNRIAHHEPIWKWGPLFEERVPRNGAPALAPIAPAPATPEQAIVRIELIHERVADLIAWCDPALARLYRSSEAFEAFKHLNTPLSLDYYRCMRTSCVISASDFRQARRLKRKLNRSSRLGQPLFYRKHPK